MKAHGYAALSQGARLQPFDFERRDAGPRDVVMDILYCGICHSDMHFVNNDWHFSMYPMVPGHEIVGRVTAVGSQVTKLRPGDLAAIGCIVDSCRACSPCEHGLEQMCVENPTATYNSYERGGTRMTFGGYSDCYVADERYVMRVPKGLDPAGAAPLLCAGITTYSPLRHWQVGPGKRVGIVGLGGLGHMALKLAHAMGAEVVQFSTSPGKAEDAKRLGADEIVISTDAAQMQRQAGSFDFILDTVSAAHDINAYLAMLKIDSTLCLVGLPPEPLPVAGFSLVAGRKSLAGSPIGGMPETQEMLDFCGTHGITADIEMIAIPQVNEAFARLHRNDVKYRFVLDTASLRG